MFKGTGKLGGEGGSRVREPESRGASCRSGPENVVGGYGLEVDRKVGGIKMDRKLR